MYAWIYKLQSRQGAPWNTLEQSEVTTAPVEKAEEGSPTPCGRSFQLAHILLVICIVHCICQQRPVSLLIAAHSDQCLYFWNSPGDDSVAPQSQSWGDADFSKVKGLTSYKGLFQSDRLSSKWDLATIRPRSGSTSFRSSGEPRMPSSAGPPSSAPTRSKLVG